MTEASESRTSHPHYRPFTLARSGELAAYKDLSPGVHAGMTPVFVIPARDWDYDNETFAKTPAAHLKPMPAKLHTARGNRTAFIDLSLLDDENPIHDHHPLQWIVTESENLGLSLIPLVTPDSSPALLAATAEIHAANGRGIAIRVTDKDWPGIDNSAVTTLLETLDVTEDHVDLFLDFEDRSGPFVIAAVQNEMRSNTAGTWRSITAGGHAWPETLPQGQGCFVLPRTDWTQFTGSYRGLKESGARTPDFFDHLVTNPEATLDIDPKLLTISATFRYTAEPGWVFVRGELYKAAAGRGKGGKSVGPALQTLQSHALYGTSLRTKAENWIDNAANGGPSGNPMTWRRWASYRHVEVTLHSLANSL